MAKLINRITIIDSDGEASTVYRPKRKKRRVSRMLRPLERAEFRTVKAGETFASDLLRRTRRSRRKRRNGWFREAPINLMRAGNKALKKLAKM